MLAIASAVGSLGCGVTVYVSIISSFLLPQTKTKEVGRVGRCCLFVLSPPLRIQCIRPSESPSPDPIKLSLAEAKTLHNNATTTQRIGTI